MPFDKNNTTKKIYKLVINDIHSIDTGSNDTTHITVNEMLSMSSSIPLGAAFNV